MVNIIRKESDDKQTLGEMVIDGYEITFKTLELPWLNNQRTISCIPTGTYQVIKRNSNKYEDHFYIVGVPDRDWILIHSGNYHQDTQGCILVGQQYLDINKDGHHDVTNSKFVMNKLNEILPEEFTLIIQ